MYEMIWLCREMQGYVELKQQMPVRPRHLIGGQAKEQLALGSNAHSQHKNALDAVTSALHVLAAVLTVSEEGRSLACASCRYACLLMGNMQDFF